MKIGYVKWYVKFSQFVSLLQNQWTHKGTSQSFGPDFVYKKWHENVRFYQTHYIGYTVTNDLLFCIVFRFAEEGPNLTKLPDGLLQVFGNQLNQCCYGDDLSNYRSSTTILQCLIILCRWALTGLVSQTSFVRWRYSMFYVIMNQTV